MLVTHDTPVGRLSLATTDAGLAVCGFTEPQVITERYATSAAGTDLTTDVVSGGPATGWSDLARRELDEYFAGSLRDFSVPVDLRLAAAFDRRVLTALVSTIRYGNTTTYGALARSIGLPTGAARSVGRAMAVNPVLIVVPCHRVLGANGGLTGYAGGLPAKRHLLDLEAAAHRPPLDLTSP